MTRVNQCTRAPRHQHQHYSEQLQETTWHGWYFLFHSFISVIISRCLKLMFRCDNGPSIHALIVLGGGMVARYPKPTPWSAHLFLLVDKTLAIYEGKKLPVYTFHVLFSNRSQHRSKVCSLSLIWTSLVVWCPQSICTSSLFLGETEVSIDRSSLGTSTLTCVIAACDTLSSTPTGLWS